MEPGLVDAQHTGSSDDGGRLVLPPNVVVAGLADRAVHTADEPVVPRQGRADAEPTLQQRFRRELRSGTARTRGSFREATD